MGRADEHVMPSCVDEGICSGDTYYGRVAEDWQWSGENPCALPELSLDCHQHVSASLMFLRCCCGHVLLAEGLSVHRSW